MDSKSQKDVCQNRLLVATAVLSFIYYAGAKFQKLTIAGASVTFENEHAMVEFLWVVWFYYYIRSYQYYKKTGVQAFVDAMNSSYLKSFGHLLVQMKSEDFDLLPDDDAIKSSKIRLSWASFSNSKNLRQSHRKLFLYPQRKIRLWRRKRGGRINLIKKEKPWYLRVSLNIESILNGMFLAVVYPPENRFTLRGQEKYTVPLPWWVPVRVLSVYLRTAIARPEFIENQGPLIIGLIPVWLLVGSRIAKVIGVA